jgi:hypothetical protein
MPAGSEAYLGCLRYCPARGWRDAGLTWLGLDPCIYPRAARADPAAPDRDAGTMPHGDTPCAPRSRRHSAWHHGTTACVAELSRSLDQGGAATRHRVRRSPRRALPWKARPARPRRPQPVGAADLPRLFVTACGTTAPPSSSLSIVQLPAAASRAPAASLRDRHAPTLDPAPTRRGFAPTRRTRWSSQTGFS